MSIRFDSMVIDDLGRQTEAKSAWWLFFENLGSECKEANYWEQYEVGVNFFFFFSMEETRLTIYRLNRRKDYKEEIEYLREKGKLEE